MANETDGRIQMAFSSMVTSLVCTLLSIIPIVPHRVFVTCLGMFIVSGAVFAYLTYKLGQEDLEWKEKLKNYEKLDK